MGNLRPRFAALGVFGLSVLKLKVLFCITRTCAGDWIDPDTPAAKLTTKSLLRDSNGKSLIQKVFNTSIFAADRSRIERGKTFRLVMSDEFNLPGRTFNDGHDPKWTAIDKNDYTNDALHYYTPDNIATNDQGELEVLSTIGDKNVVGFDDVLFKRTGVTKHFKSGMLQSWNKFCFTGGIIEAEVILPGWHDVGGLWPAFWLLGNLARHTFVGSSAHVWPFSTHDCNDVVADAQLINGCGHVAHYGLEHDYGRGAPEIDIFEIQPGSIKRNKRGFLRSTVGQPFMSASFQVAPGRPDHRPGSGYWPGPGEWYTGMKHGNDTCLNILYYGVYNFFRNDLTPKNDYWSDAISYNRQLGESHFTERHTYRVEWGLPKEKNERENEFDSGYLSWFLDGELVWTMNGTSLEEQGYGGEISTEPMSILINTAISSQWGFPECVGECECRTFDCTSDQWQDKCGFNPGFCEMMKAGAKMKVNWVRVYQDEDDEAHKVGCSTPERPTRRFIEANAKSYKRDEDIHPLKAIQSGRGRCDRNLPASHVGADFCGGIHRGVCTAGNVCECKSGWTGPNCLVPTGSDPIDYDPPSTLEDLKFGFGLPFLPTVLWIVLLGLALMIIVAVVVKSRVDEYKPIPEIR